MPYVPERTAAAAVLYTFRLTGGKSITAAVNLAYQSETGDVVGSPAAAVPARTLVDGRITRQSLSSHWSAAVSGTNLLDKQYYINKRDLTDAWGMVIGQPGRPREWALTLTRTF